MKLKILLLGRKAMTNLDSILKSRDHFSVKGPCSESSGFSSSHVGLWQLDHKEGWVLKNWCFQLVVLERLFRVPRTARRSNQSILKGINPEYSLEGLMLKLKLQNFGQLMWRVASLEKTLMLGKTEGRTRGWQSMKFSIVETHYYYLPHCICARDCAHLSSIIYAFLGVSYLLGNWCFSYINISCYL